MVGLVVLLFVVVPIVEIWILFQLAEVVGAGPTVALVLATGILGGAVARWQGTTALQDIVGAVRSGRAPEAEVAAGALFVAGAAFLLTPGVVTDVAGFLLMVPPVRRWAGRRLAERIQASGAVVHVEVGGPPPGAGGLGGEPPQEPKRVDADATVRDGSDDEG